ncbi:MAG: tetratricopeptide repeat protein, partial [Bacteroidota bacterium]
MPSLRCLYTILILISILSITEGQDSISNLNDLEVLNNSIEQETNDSKKSDLLQEYAFAKLHSEPEVAFEYANKAIEYAKKASYKKGLANGYHTLGLIYWYKNSYEFASDFFFDALEIREEIKDTMGMGRSYNNIGNLYFRQNNYDEALSYYERSLEVRKSVKDSVGILYCFNSLAEVFEKQNQTNKAFEYYSNALQLAQKLSREKGAAFVYGNFGRFYLNQNEFPQARKHFEKALQISQKVRHKNGIAENFNNISETLILQNKELPHAISLAKSSISHSDSIGAMDIKANAYKNLSKAYALLGDYEEAFKYEQLKGVTESEVFNREMMKSVVQRQADYKMTEQKTQILEKENELLQKEKQLSNISLLAILSLLLGLLISGFFIYTKWKYQKKTNQLLELKNKELTDSNEALERFAFASSHDLREPLNNINSFTGLILKDAAAANNEKHVKYASVIQDSCKNLDS